MVGGLTLDNVADAIAAAQPFCVDVASGVEYKPGSKARQLLAAFVHAEKSAPQL
jgi:phosphoribosylanthranilate isomerase